MNAREHPVIDHPELSRFETETSAGLAVLEYLLSGERLSLNHTEVPQAARKRGIGTRLVAAALQHARARGLTVVPRCPFVRAYVARHPEVRGLIEEPE
ncbi:MAG: N-acetyltransferase [Candidatus Eisenbacteria bacterium]|uniref:N-acetyltransferase n=1 Tax=Eiseniibacteriota bacterium TaxID=2212470 RepID=A0A538U899_UNCEI|nr:MAG: N-acetyltransferase [Candidatus Eisenbacteria bacterium]